MAAPPDPNNSSCSLPCFPDVPLSFTFTQCGDASCQRAGNLHKKVALLTGLHYLIMLWGTELMFRYLLVSQAGEKGQRSLIHLIFPVNGKTLFSDADCYYQVHAGASWTQEQGIQTRIHRTLSLEGQVNLVNKHKNQGLTEGHGNLSYMQEGSSEIDHRLSCHGVLATKSLLQHYPMAESS